MIAGAPVSFSENPVATGREFVLISEGGGHFAIRTKCPKSAYVALRLRMFPGKAGEQSAKGRLKVGISISDGISPNLINTHYETAVSRLLVKIAHF